MRPSSSPYPKPSAIGGTLIRKVIALFKSKNFELPITEPVAIATSGGVDSMVLAHLIAKYGRKIIDPQLVTLLHFDHQWRKESSTVEPKAIAQLARKMGVAFETHTLRAPDPKSKTNLEAASRSERLKFFDKHVGAKKRFRYVLTAHHQNDVAETVFWRFLRGELKESGAILFSDDQQLRPFLKVSKEELYAYATAEKIAYFEDPTNQDPDRMRAFLRTRIFPELEKHFPALTAVIANYAETKTDESMIPTAIESIVGSKLNRVQRLELEKMLRNAPNGGRLTVSKGIVIERKARGFFIEIPDYESGQHSTG